MLATQGCPGKGAPTAPGDLPSGHFPDLPLLGASPPGQGTFPRGRPVLYSATFPPEAAQMRLGVNPKMGRVDPLGVLGQLRSSGTFGSQIVLRGHWQWES